MKTRGNMSAVIDGLQREHGLLAAYLEATDKIGWRALHKPVAITEMPKPFSVEAHQVTAAPQLPEVVPPTSPFVLRRANLVRIWPRTWISEKGEPSGTAPQRLEAATAPMRAAVRIPPLARLTALMDGAARRLETATAPMRAAVRIPPLARLTAFMDGAARRLEATTAPVQTQRKFAVFIVACLVVASFAGTYFHDGITAVLSQYPAHSDMLASELAGAKMNSQETLSRKASEEAEQRQALEGTVTELGQSLQQEREKTMALEQQAKTARLAETRTAELQPGARRDQTHGPQRSSSVRHHRARSRCFWFLFQIQCF